MQRRAARGLDGLDTNACYMGEPEMSLAQRSTAEFVGTFWLVFGGCGSAVLSAAFPNVGIGLLGVALAFGLTVLTMAYAIGHISGCHLNPAVSVGLAAGGRFPARELIPYVVAQVARRDRRRGRALPDRERQAGLRPRRRASRRTATASTRPAATRMVAALRRRGRAHVHVPGRSSSARPTPRAGGLRAASRSASASR